MRKLKSGKPDVPTKGRKLTKQLKRRDARIAGGTWDLQQGRKKPGSLNRHKSQSIKGK